MFDPIPTEVKSEIEFPVSKVDKSKLNMKALDRIASFLESENDFEFDMSYSDDCIMGVIDYLDLFKEFNFKLEDCNLSLCYENLLGLPINEFTDESMSELMGSLYVMHSLLFFPVDRHKHSLKFDFYNDTDQKGAARVIRHLMETGEIDWRKAIPDIAD